MLLLEDGRDCLVATYPRIWERAKAYLLTDRLDHALASGARPDSNVLLALRAQVLTSEPTRRSLAFGLERIVDQVRSPGSTLRMIGIPICRARVQPNLPELELICQHLRSNTLVPARGVARIHILLTTGFDPLGSGRTQDLAGALNDILSALDFDKSETA